MTTKEKVSEVVKNHKKEIAVAAVTVIGGVALTAVGIHWKHTKEGIVKMPGFTIEGGLTVKDLGKLGEEFMKHDEFLTPNTEVLEVGTFRFGDEFSA